MSKNLRWVLVSLFLAGLILVVYGNNYGHSKAAAPTCSAGVTWAKSSINAGDDATEAWVVNGAAKASAHCYDTNAGGTLDSKITDTLSFGPQSYTFHGVQHNITCEVTATAADGTSCISNGPQTVTVVSSGGANPVGGGGSGGSNGNNYPNGQNPPGTACYNLFWHSTNSPSAWHFTFPQNQNLSAVYSYDWSYGAIEEYWASDNVSMKVSNPSSLPSGINAGLPPGITLSSHIVKYPTVNMNNDGLNTDAYVNADVGKGYPDIFRYALAGTPTQQGKWQFSLTSSKSASCTQTQTFEIDVTGPVAPPAPAPKPADVPPAPKSTNGLISFVKTIFYADAPPDGSQKIGDMETWGKNGDKFLMSGDYGGSLQTVGINGQSMSGGGGLWTVAQDGSQIVERQAAIDAGSGTNYIYQHGIRHASYAINYEWGAGGFVMDNGSWSSCLQYLGNDAYCTKYGGGAQEAVYYKQGSDGYPVIAGTSDPNGSTPMIALKNKVIYGGELMSLPKWGDLGPADTSVMGSLSYGDNIIDSKGEVFSVASDGTTEDTGNNLIDQGWTWQNIYSWDWSQGFPPELAVWEVQTKPDTTYGLLYTAAKVKVFKLASDGSVVLDRTMNAPVNPSSSTVAQAVANGFGIWGNYLITPATSVKTGDGLNIWKADQKMDTVTLPLGSIGYNGKAVAISKGGYILVNAARTSERAILVYLYKLNLSSSGTSGSGGGGTGTGIGTGTGGGTPTIGSGTCYALYPNNIQLQTLCEQIDALKKQVCGINPSLSLCSSLNSGGGGGGNGNNSVNQPSL